MAVPDLQDAIDHLQEKDVEAAIATLERKIEELPAHLTAHVLLARAYEAKHEWTQALTCWENVHFLIPNSPVGQEGKARVLRKLDRKEEAEEAARAAEQTPSPTSLESREEPAALPPPNETKDEDDVPPSTPTEAASELEQLRRQAEKEARERSARSEFSSQGSPDEETAADAPPDVPEERMEDLGDENDLDRLIDELESARIEPRPDVDEVPPPDLDDDIDDLVSETLARIHEAQDQYRQAAQIYVKLASQEPTRARDFLEKAAEMRERAEQQALEN